MVIYSSGGKNMKNTNKIAIISILLLLAIGLTITPALGNSIAKQTQKHTATAVPLSLKETTTIEIIDFTGKIPIKIEKQLPKSQWKKYTEELQHIRKTSTTTENSINQQFKLMKNYNLIAKEITYEQLQAKLSRRSVHPALKNIVTTPLNNTIFNAMCAIDFHLTNGTTAVFGLNTFINLIGLDIISVHKGYADDGIDTKGILQQQTEPGEYLGSMFGFLGYWAGEKTSAGFYSEVTAAGFTVITVWVPIEI